MEIEGFTLEDVKNKIKSIRSTYYLELDKIKKSSTSGASGNVYQPKLSEDETVKFVTIYRENPCLWDITSEHYKNKAMRQTALQNLCIGMEIEGFTLEDVKNKIKSIRSTYYLELDKIKKSSTSGASGNVYQPKVKWFAEFNSFIRNVMVKLEDEFDIFGKHIAKQLRTLSTEQAILGQEEIQSNNKAAYEWMDGSKYLLRSKFMDWWKSTVNKALKTFQHRDNVPIYFVNGVEYKIHKSESGPAMTLFIKNVRRGFKLDVDLVPALKFPESRWPIGRYYRQIPPGCCKNTWMVVGKPNKGAPPLEQERSWRIALHNQERQLMHNSYHLRQAVRLNTWMVVGKPNKGAPPHEQERSWRIALHNLGRELMHNSYHLRQAVRLLGMKKIASYYIKTLFFWEIVEQNNEAFWRNNPAFLFKHMVKKLHTALVHSNIPYFWNKRNNLIGNVESRVLSGYAAKLVPLMQILDNPNGSNYKLVAKYLLSPKEFKEYNEKFLHI
ncbi:ADP-ribosylation factor-like protein [Operophtera brumata]|uniref:ADP-ribosylation factor-like protein n=1 Tax=Operophtera brumata TaxID=104452 RepID=A0A0L7LMG2_OPEBR|nr:ADP-ribosylation factor-like protein [Operophtera brumata]